LREFYYRTLCDIPNVKISHISEEESPARFITRVRPSGEEEVQCIKIAHPSHLYITNGIMPTHNTYDSSQTGPDAASSGSGHAQPLTAKVLTTQGYKSMGEIDIGDEVVTIDGSATKVSGIYPQGEQEIFRVQLSDGGVTRTTADHIWLVRPEGAANFREMSLAEMMPEVLKGRRFELPFLQEAA
jgi:hypothetical protein